MGLKFMGNKTVIFDLDGTLYAMSPLFKPMLTLLSAPHILYVPKYMKVRERYRGKEFSSSSRLQEVLENDFEELTGCKKTREWIEEVFYKAFIKTLTFLRNRKEVNEIFRELKSKEYKIAVISDFAMVNERLLALDIDISLIDFITSSEDEGAFKPNLKVFDRLIKELEVDRDNLIIVGDRDDTDGEASRKLGARFINVNGKNNDNWLDAIKELRALG
jgi:FMN phosphatase YigB (HAD superfamily)